MTTGTNIPTPPILTVKHKKSSVRCTDNRKFTVPEDVPLATYFTCNIKQFWRLHDHLISHLPTTNSGTIWTYSKQVIMQDMFWCIIQTAVTVIHAWNFSALQKFLVSHGLIMHSNQIITFSATFLNIKMLFCSNVKINFIFKIWCSSYMISFLALPTLTNKVTCLLKLFGLILEVEHACN